MIFSVETSGPQNPPLPCVNWSQQQLVKWFVTSICTSARTDCFTWADWIQFSTIFLFLNGGWKYTTRWWRTLFLSASDGFQLLFSGWCAIWQDAWAGTLRRVHWQILTTVSLQFARGHLPLKVCQVLASHVSYAHWQAERQRSLWRRLLPSLLRWHVPDNRNHGGVDTKISAAPYTLSTHRVPVSFQWHLYIRMLTKTWLFQLLYKKNWSVTCQRESVAGAVSRCLCFRNFSASLTAGRESLNFFVVKLSD